MSGIDLTESEIQAVIAVLQSGRLALGPQSKAFEAAIADYVGARYAVAVSSGTAALHVAVRALGIGPDDEVIVPSFTFAASVNAILFVGAVPIFVDIEEDTYNLDPDDVNTKISPRTKAIMAVDVFGHPADWTALEKIAEHRNLKIIDDSCEALGAAYNTRRLGTFGDAAAFAFYPNKQITTGEGGMLVTNNPTVAEAARSLRNQGRNAMGAWLEHERLGYNYRLNEMSAALGVAQMRRIDEILARRAAVANRYTYLLRQHCPAVSPPVIRDGIEASWFVYVVTLPPNIDRDHVISILGERGIPTRAYFSPIHRQPYLRKYATDVSLPVTEKVAARTLALPFFGHLAPEDQERVVMELARALET